MPRWARSASPVGWCNGSRRRIGFGALLLLVAAAIIMMSEIEAEGLVRKHRDDDEAAICNHHEVGIGEAKIRRIVRGIAPKSAEANPFEGVRFDRGKYETKPNTSGKCWSLGKSMVLHHRSRSATGSHPGVTVVAKSRSDNCAAPLSRLAREGDRKCVALRRGREVPSAIGMKVQKQTHRGVRFDRGKYETKPNTSGKCWSLGTSRCSTTGREARPALTRPSQLSRSPGATTAPPTFSRKAREGMWSRAAK